MTVGKGHHEHQKPKMNKQGNPTAENVKASDTNSNGSVKKNDDFWTSEDEDFPKVVKPGDNQVKKKECSIHSSDSDNSSMDSIEFEQQPKTFSCAEKWKWNNGEEEWKPRDDGKDYDHEDKMGIQSPWIWICTASPFFY
jgi:hypothetical protein